MVLVHRLKGEPIFVNADLIESIDACPDTVLVLVDGRTLVLADRPEEIVERVVRFRASVLVAADDLRQGGLTLVHDAER